MSRKCRWVFLGLLALAQIGIVVCYVSMLRGTPSAAAASPMPAITDEATAPVAAVVSEKKGEPASAAEPAKTTTTEPTPAPPAWEVKEAALPAPAVTKSEGPAPDDRALAAEPTKETASEKPSPKKDAHLEHEPLDLPASQSAPPLPAPAAAPPVTVAVAPPPPALSSPVPPPPSPGGTSTKPVDGPAPPSADKKGAEPPIPAPPPLATPAETKPATTPPPPPSPEKADKAPPLPSVSIPAPPAPKAEKPADPLLAPPAPSAPFISGLKKAAPPASPAPLPPPAVAVPEPAVAPTPSVRIPADAPAARVDNPPAPCPWTLRMEIVKGRTQLEARVGKEVQFRVDCAQLSIGAPSGCLSARGDVHLTGSDLDGTCEGLTINWQDDHVLLDGKAHLRCLRNGQDVELNADHLSLRLSTSSTVKGTGSSSTRKASAKPDASAEESEENDLK